MAIFLIFYKWAIEDVTMHRFKRGYLLGALVLSFLIPIVPTGYSYISETPLAEEGIADFSMIEVNKITQEIIEPESSTSFAFILSLLFLSISSIFFIRFFRNIGALLSKARVNQKIEHNTAQLVLTHENIEPHTFLDKIYINKEEYLNGQIDEQLLVHEQAHADQRHSWDIIFIEVLMCIFWFNPLLIMYKSAIQLNHEFLADEKVIKQYNQVKKYQYLLLDTIKNNNQISLASSINFSLTKKRLEMMTKKSTARRKNLLILSILPLIMILLVALGSPIVAQTDTKEKITLQEKKNSLRDNYYKEAIIHYTDSNGRKNFKSFNALPEDIKNKLVVPPPPPPTPDGKSQWQSMLKKGTIVTLKENGSIHVGEDGNVPPPPPPPAPTKVPKRVNGAGFPPPPPAPPRDIENNIPPPPPPPPIPQVKDLAEQGVTIYLNGMKVKDEVAKTICEEFDSKTMKLKVSRNGSKSLYIENKD